MTRQGVADYAAPTQVRAVPGYDANSNITLEFSF